MLSPSTAARIEPEFDSSLVVCRLLFGMTALALEAETEVVRCKATSSNDERGTLPDSGRSRCFKASNEALVSLDMQPSNTRRNGKLVFITCRRDMFSPVEEFLSGREESCLTKV